MLGAYIRVTETFEHLVQGSLLGQRVVVGVRGVGQLLAGRARGSSGRCPRLLLRILLLRRLIERLLHASETLLLDIHDMLCGLSTQLVCNAGIGQVVLRRLLGRRGGVLSRELLVDVLQRL